METVESCELSPHNFRGRNTAAPRLLRKEERNKELRKILIIAMTCRLLPVDEVWRPDESAPWSSDNENS